MRVNVAGFNNNLESALMNPVCRRSKFPSTRTFARYLSTESHTSPNSQPTLPPPPPARPVRSSRLSPRPRAQAPESDALHIPLRLPPSFGRNQLLPVSNSTRALLEEIVGTFHAPIRYAFAYGSGVFEQEGQSIEKDNRPMLDFIFAVSHPEHWHSINLHQNPSHYAAHARLLGSDFIGRVQDLGPAAVWFNPFVSVAGVVRAARPFPNVFS